MKITNKNKLLEQCYNFIDNGDGRDVGVFLSLLAVRYLLMYKATKKQFLKSLSNAIDIINKEIGNND